MPANLCITQNKISGTYQLAWFNVSFGWIVVNLRPLGTSEQSLAWGEGFFCTLEEPWECHQGDESAQLKKREKNSQHQSTTVQLSPEFWFAGMQPVLNSFHLYTLFEQKSLVSYFRYFREDAVSQQYSVTAAAKPVWCLGTSSAYTLKLRQCVAQATVHNLWVTFRGCPLQVLIFSNTEP